MKVLQISWKTLLLVTIALSFFLVTTIARATEDPRADRDKYINETRDRLAAFCDPAAYPYEVRGEFLDCSGFEPTTAPVVQPTQPGQPAQPTATPRVGNPPNDSVNPTSTPGPSDDGNDGDDDDPCASGKSYTGDYCGWSPGVGGDGGGGGDAPRIGEPGGPQIKGLSYTSGSELVPSDIILLTGVLCLLLYVRSKITVGSVNPTNRKQRLGSF